MALTDTAVRKAKPKEKPYKVTDSLGLYLVVNPQGSKLWRLKYRMEGVERKLSIGAYAAAFTSSGFTSWWRKATAHSACAATWTMARVSFCKTFIQLAI